MLEAIQKQKVQDYWCRATAHIVGQLTGCGEILEVLLVVIAGVGNHQVGRSAGVMDTPLTCIEQESASKKCMTASEVDLDQVKKS